MRSATDEIKELIYKVECLTEEEENNLKMLSKVIRSNNRRKAIDKLNRLTKEKSLINDELVALDEELKTIIFKQSEMEKREAQLFERLKEIEEQTQKIVQMYDLIN